MRTPGPSSTRDPSALDKPALYLDRADAARAYGRARGYMTCGGWIFGPGGARWHGWDALAVVLIERGAVLPIEGGARFILAPAPQQEAPQQEAPQQEADATTTAPAAASTTITASTPASPAPAPLEIIASDRSWLIHRGAQMLASGPLAGPARSDDELRTLIRQRLRDGRIPSLVDERELWAARATEITSDTPVVRAPGLAQDVAPLSCLASAPAPAPAEEAECLGHPAGGADPMGETVYCDGSCRRTTTPAAGASGAAQEAIAVKRGGGGPRRRPAKSSTTPAPATETPPPPPLPAMPPVPSKPVKAPPKRPRPSADREHVKALRQEGARLFLGALAHAAGGRREEAQAAIVKSRNTFIQAAGEAERLATAEHREAEVLDVQDPELQEQAGELLAQEAEQGDLSAPVPEIAEQARRLIIEKGNDPGPSSMGPIAGVREQAAGQGGEAVHAAPAALPRRTEAPRTKRRTPPSSMKTAPRPAVAPLVTRARGQTLAIPAHVAELARFALGVGVRTGTLPDDDYDLEHFMVDAIFERASILVSVRALAINAYNPRWGLVGKTPLVLGGEGDADHVMIMEM